MDALFEIDLQLPAARGSAARALGAQLKQAIAAGRLAPGSKLPATRQAGRLLGVSRNTAAGVYEQLVCEGYLVTRRGSGTYVAPRPAQARGAARRTAPAYALNEFWQRPDIAGAIGFWRERSESLPAAEAGRAIELRPGLVDARLFPFETFRQMNARRLRSLERNPADYKSPQGHQGNYHLRSAITRYVALTRAVACDADDVLVTSGAQQAFDLLARVLVTPGRTVVAVEDPGYPPLRVPFAAAGARIVPVPVDAEGLVVERLPPDAGVVCVCPSHQYPLGVSLSPRRRQALVEFARRRGAVLVEDDYDGEFRFEGSPLEALRTADSADVVFYVGTFSKCMLPALRLGFVVAPAWALPALIAAKNALDWHCSVPIQLAVASFIGDGHLARHVRRMREIYRARREHLLGLLSGELGAWLEPLPSFCGMHVAALARTDADLDGLAQTLLARRVRLHALSRYYLGAARAGLVIGYGAADLNDIGRGMAALRAALVSGVGRPSEPARSAAPARQRLEPVGGRSRLQRARV